MNDTYNNLEQFKKNGYYTSRFPFIRDNIYLVACVNIKTGKQILKIEKVDFSTEEVLESSRIDCIHTAISRISVDEFFKLHGDIDGQEEFYKRNLNIQSSENLEEIKLCPEEKFIAFKSWVAGIAEAGENSFRIQTEIDRNLTQTPIAHFLLKKITLYDENYLPKFLDNIERECIFNGKIHEPCMVANLEELDELFLKRSSTLYHNLYHPMILLFIIENFPKYLFIHKDPRIRIEVAKNINAPIKYPEEYKLLFSDKDFEVRKAVAENKNAPRLENEYRRLYHDKELDVRCKVAANADAAMKFPELHIRKITEGDKSRESMALNPEIALRFPNEFKKLFYDENYYVRANVAKNPEAVHFLEYVKLFKDKNWLVRGCISKNPNVRNLFPKLFKKLSKDKDSRVRSVMASSTEEAIHEKERIKSNNFSQYEFFHGIGVPLSEYL